MVPSCNKKHIGKYLNVKITNFFERFHDTLLFKIFISFFVNSDCCVYICFDFLYKMNL